MVIPRGRENEQWIIGDDSRAGGTALHQVVRNREVMHLSVRAGTAIAPDDVLPYIRNDPCRGSQPSTVATRRLVVCDRIVPEDHVPGCECNTAATLGAVLDNPVVDDARAVARAQGNTSTVSALADIPRDDVVSDQDPPGAGVHSKSTGMGVSYSETSNGGSAERVQKHAIPARSTVNHRFHGAVFTEEVDILLAGRDYFFRVNAWTDPHSTESIGRHRRNGTAYLAEWMGAAAVFDAPAVRGIHIDGFWN